MGLFKSREKNSIFHKHTKTIGNFKISSKRYISFKIQERESSNAENAFISPIMAVLAIAFPIMLT